MVNDSGMSEHTQDTKYMTQDKRYKIRDTMPLIYVMVDDSGMSAHTHGTRYEIQDTIPLNYSNGR